MPKPPVRRDYSRVTLRDRFAPGQGLLREVVSKAVIPTFIGGFFGYLAAVQSGGNVLLWQIAGALIGLVGGTIAILVSMWAGGSIAEAFIQPSGDSTPYEEDFSAQETLLVHGKVDEALASYEDIIARENLCAPRLKAADAYMKHQKNPERAEQLYREVQRFPGVSDGDFIYATNKLVDIYLWRAGDKSKALSELRRLAERVPGSATAAQARSAYDRLRKEMLEEARMRTE